MDTRGSGGLMSTAGGSWGAGSTPAAPAWTGRAPFRVPGARPERFSPSTKGPVLGVLRRVDDRIEELRRRVEAHLETATGKAARVSAIAPLAGGACQDNLRVEVSLEGDAAPRALVLRSDAARSLPGSISRREEYHVICAAVAAGVRTPAARWPAEGLTREGAHAYFLDWIDGDAIGRRVLRDERLARAREGLAAALAAELAKIHSIRPGGALAGALEPPPGGDPAAAALAAARGHIDALPEPRPALELAMEWLEDHRPSPREVVLVHGDFRTGNFMVTPEGLSGVLDWEFAHFGAPEEDLAWIALRNWRFGVRGLPAGGLARREDFHAAYARASGREVRAGDVHWWSVMGNVRWATGCVQQGERYLGGEQDIELIAIPAHAFEMEFEALRLIEMGPPPAED